MKKRTKVLYWFYKLSWKKLLGIGTFLLMLGAYLPIQQAALEKTRTQTEAALLPKPQPITTEFETPTGPPEIYLVDHFFGKTDDAVLIHGENLGGLHQDSWVSLAGEKIAEDNLVSWTGSYIEFKVPTGAKSGQVEVSILGKKASWSGVFFVTNETTEAELKLVAEADSNQAQLLGQGLGSGKELLVWLLIISGDGDLKLSSVKGVEVSQKVRDLPVGRVYEVKLKLSSSLATESQGRLVPLLTVVKSEGQMVGIARGELSDDRGALKPLQAHPLYVSY
jgi:hypothetical protein